MWLGSRLTSSPTMILGSPSGRAWSCRYAANSASLLQPKAQATCRQSRKGSLPLSGQIADASCAQVYGAAKLRMRAAPKYGAAVLAKAANQCSF